MVTTALKLIGVIAATVSAAPAPSPSVNSTSSRLRALQEKATYPNVGRAFRGYDIMKGNPRMGFKDTELDDPGFRHPIFKADYTEGRTDADVSHSIPKGLSIMSCLGTGQSSFQSETILGETSYQNSLKRSVSADYAAWAAAFSASADSQEMTESESSSKHVFATAYASRCSYIAELRKDTPPPFDDNFVRAYGLLPTEYDEAKYMEFLNNFGTHYITYAKMGAEYGRQYKLSTDAYSRLQYYSLDVNVAAEYSAEISGGVDLQNQQQVEQSKRFMEEKEGELVWSKGQAPPGPDSDSRTWMQDPLLTPAPISIKVEPIDKVFDFIESTNSDEQQDGLGSDFLRYARKYQLRRALLGYCEHLHSKKLVASCSAPAEDIKKPAPKLLLRTVGTYESKWDSAGSGGHDANFLRVKPTEVHGYRNVLLGDSVYPGRGMPGAEWTTDTLLIPNMLRSGGDACGFSDSFDLMKEPLKLVNKWSDSGSGADRDGSIWEVVPHKGYVALGNVVQGGEQGTNPGQPDELLSPKCMHPNQACVCTIKEECVERIVGHPPDGGVALLPYVVYNDAGTGSHADVEIWKPTDTSPGSALYDILHKEDSPYYELTGHGMVRATWPGDVRPPVFYHLKAECIIEMH